MATSSGRRDRSKGETECRTNSLRNGDPVRPAVGVIGLGDIGDGVARNLLRAGFPLVVCDVRAEATERYPDTADVADSPAELVRRSDVVVVAVVDDAQVHAVLSGPDGGLAAAGPGTTFVVVSTISGACVQAIGAEAAGLGVAVLDCGVSGGPTAAATGDLVCMVGGDPEVIERAQPVFDAIGSLTVPMGPFGAGLAAKLARNLVQYGSWLAAYEAQRLAEAAGIVLTDLARPSGPATSASAAPRPSCSARRWRRSPTPTTPGWSVPCGRRPAGPQGPGRGARDGRLARGRPAAGGHDRDRCDRSSGWARWPRGSQRVGGLRDYQR